MTTQRFAKRMILINRDFQLRYVWAAVALGLVTTVVSSILILYPLYQFEILKIPRFLPWPILIMMGGAALLNIAVIAIFGVYVTHRIAGPMFALGRAFRCVELGQWRTYLKVRTGDDLLYLVRNFNEMVDGLITAVKSDLADLQTIQDSCSDENVRTVIAGFEAKVRQRIGNDPVEGSR